MKNADDVLSFWFEELEPSQWYVADPELDRHIQEEFLETHSSAAACELAVWRDTPNGRLAEVIVLDQFSRNLFRNQAKAFAYDALALSLSQAAIASGDDQELTPEKRAFLYLPFMHSESRQIHEQAMHLFAQPGLEGNLDFEKKHKDIIDRFGRYPHRNAILGRESSVEEIEFLKQPGSGF